MRPRLRGRFLIGACLALIAVIRATSAMAVVIPDALYDKAAREGSVRVIVQFRVTTTPEGELESADAVASQRQDIAAMRYAALAELAETNYRTIREFETIPFVALEVTQDALMILEAFPSVVGVEEDQLLRPLLSQSIPLVGAPQAWAAGFDGTGVVVAILDSGVDKNHSFLAGKVIEEACFTSNNSCPNGTNSQIGSGAGVPCTYAPDACRHGTHVAGIAAGAGANFSGVAKGAQIIAVQVFSRSTGSACTNAGASEDPCALVFEADVIAGGERVLALSGQYTIAAVNLSLGGGKFTSPCDSQAAAGKAIIDNLRSVGIATVASSGNDGFSDALVAPACVSTAVSVGATTKADIVSTFSNSATFLSLLAPGSFIDSSVPGGGFDFFSGTSQATPHVVGAWAILKQKKSNATVTEVLNALTSTGLPITDPKNGITKPRIRVAQALQALTTSHSLTITSGPGGSPNPVVSAGSASLTVTATDSLGHSLTYAWVASCPTLGSNGGFNNATLRTPTWTAPANATGSQQTCTISVTVSDGQGLTQVGSYVQGVTTTMPTLPDLVPSINPVPSSGTPGGTIQLNASVVNQGGTAAGAFRLGFYFSTDTTITTGDVFFTSCTFSGLAVGQSRTCSGPVTIPTSLSPGVYFVGAVADDQSSIAESNEGNNRAFAGPITVTQGGSSRLINISTRALVQTGAQVMIAGFIIGGTTPKTVLVRAIGPYLATFGVPGALPDPVVQLFSGQTAIAANDDWQTSAQAAAISATGLAPSHPREAAILITLNPGPYTAIVSGFEGTTGVGLVEVFEVGADASGRLINISTRSLVRTGAQVMIAGFIIGGTTPKTVLVRAIGPSLATFGVPGALPDPVVQLFSGQTAIAANDDWQTSTQAAAIAAIGLAPSHPREAAILITLAPGPYTAIVSGVGGTTGVGLVEVFEVATTTGP